jgi:hypothetical protein
MRSARKSVVLFALLLTAAPYARGGGAPLSLSDAERGLFAW